MARWASTYLPSLHFTKHLEWNKKKLRTSIFARVSLCDVQPGTVHKSHASPNAIIEIIVTAQNGIFQSSVNMATDKDFALLEEKNRRLELEVLLLKGLFN